MKSNKLTSVPATRGDPTPSRADISMTEQVQFACEAIGVVVHDHVIIGKETELSFRSERLL